MSSKKKKKKAGKDKAKTTEMPPDSPHALRDVSAEDVSGLGEDSDHEGHNGSLSSETSAQGPSDPSNNFITSLGLETSSARTGLEALAAMVNAGNPTTFEDSVLVARQVLDSGRDLTMVTLETFEELRLSDFRSELFQLLVHPRLCLSSVHDVLKAVPLLRAGLSVQTLAATVVAPSRLGTGSASVSAAQQSLLLNPEETKELETFTKDLACTTGWKFSKTVGVMTAERSMTPAIITDLTRILKASIPFDKCFPGGFNGLNFLQMASLTPMAVAVQMGMSVNNLTDRLNFGGGQQGLFFTGTTPPDSPTFTSEIYMQPASFVTSENCAQLQIWSTAAAQGLIQGTWPLPLSCSLIYHKVVVFQDFLYRFIVAFVTACVEAHLGWAAGMLTTLETLRDTESVKEMPRAVITSRPTPR